MRRELSTEEFREIQFALCFLRCVAYEAIKALRSGSTEDLEAAREMLEICYSDGCYALEQVMGLLEPQGYETPSEVEDILAATDLRILTH